MNELTHAVAVVKLKGEFPDLLVLNQDDYKSSLVTAAKNVRIELKKAFPKVKFKVTTSRYSGGDSLRASWVDGPTTAQVDAIIQKYSAGSFNGMDDMYTYDHNVFNEVFGDAKYVFAERSYTNDFLALVLDKIGKMYGAEPLSVADYRAGRAYYWTDRQGNRLDSEIHRTLQATAAE